MHLIRQMIGNDRRKNDSICTHIPVTRRISGMQVGPVIVDNIKLCDRVRKIDCLLRCTGLGEVSGDGSTIPDLGCGETPLA